MPEWFDELAELLRIPSVSADPARASDVRRAGEWVCDFIRAGGGTAELLDWHGQPLAIGRLAASTNPDSAPTVLCYGHFDVQPPDPLELWQSDAFEPEIRGEHLYGRGVADDKGQLYLLLRAARDLALAGELPVNVRFACDGEEETGGESIIEFLHSDHGAADVAVIFDSGMVARDRPAFSLATRGLVYLHLTLRAGERDLHSGMFGGAVLNAAHALIRALDAVVARAGRLVEPLREGVRPPTREELDSWRELPAGAERLAEQGARPLDPQAGEEFYLRTLAEPALDVNGILSGSPALQKTVIPAQATANVSLRLAPGQDPERLAPVLERLLREAVPPGAELEVQHLGSSEPGLVDPASPAVRLALDAFERALGVRPVLARSGGTLPIMPALARRGIPAILTGFALPDSNIHSPNERLLVEYVPRGIAAARELLQAFAAL